MDNDPEPGHKIDHGARDYGITAVVFSVAMTPWFVAWTIDVFTGGFLAKPVPPGIISSIITASLLWLGCSGVWSLHFPTAGGRALVTEQGIELRLRRGRTIRLPWTDIDHWGLAPRRFSRSKKALVVWPHAHASTETHQAARKLWSGWFRGWTIEAMASADNSLIDDIAQHCPHPRRDHDRKGGTFAPENDTSLSQSGEHPDG